MNVNVKIDSAFIGETGLNRVVSGEFAVYGEYIQVEVVQFKVGVTVPYWVICKVYDVTAKTGVWKVKEVGVTSNIVHAFNALLPVCFRLTKIVFLSKPFPESLIISPFFILNFNYWKFYYHIVKIFCLNW